MVVTEKRPQESRGEQGWGHAIPVASDVLADRRAGASAQRRQAADAEDRGWHGGGDVRRACRRRRSADLLRAAAGGLRHWLAGCGGDRPSGTSWRQDAL